MKIASTLLTVTLFAGTPVCAQLVNDGATNTLSNITNIITGGVMVGTNGAFTLLVLSDNAVLTNSAHGVIGGNATARSNQVQLVSPSARWLMGGNLMVGSNGASSTLEVSNGAVVENNQGYVGFLISSNNAALVTGAGSVWSNRQAFYVGQQGPFNRVQITEGGRLASASLDIGFSTASASNNEVTVTGPNSTWSIGNGIVRVGNGSGRNVLRVSNGGTVIGGSLGYVGSSTGGSNTALVTDAGSRWQAGTNLYVGLASAFNRLVISNGGAVFSGRGILGNLSSGDDNLAVVTGAGSLWHNTNNLSVGVAGARNQLVITNSGTVSGSNIVVGADGASFANRVLVDGGTLQVASASGDGALDVRRGTNVFNAGLVDVDRLVLTNAAGVFEFKGGTLITRGAFITNGTGMIVSGSGTNPAVWDVRPGATDHVVSLGVLVGFNSSFNQLLVGDGAVLSNGVSGFVGAGAGAANSNSAAISGAGSRWQVAGEVAAGAAGAFNQLTVSDGALVGAASGRVGGPQLASSNNLAAVTGAGSVWSNATSLVVGDVSPGNQLLVGGGGSVFAGGDLSVGVDGSFNSLVVSEGALVSDYHGLVGEGSGSNNVAIVTGPGSVWTNTGFLYAGASGRGHQLIVSNGGMALSFYGDVGGAGQENRAVVTDPGSIWSISNSLVLGNGGTSNRVEVRNGGLLANGLGIIGNTAGSNAVTVTGATSRWSNRLDQVVGAAASRNALSVSDGGTAFVGGDGIIGDFPAAMSNTVVVSGPGSRWLVASNLNVGNEGPFNRLVVSNGGFAGTLEWGAFVGDLEARLGSEAGSHSNLAVVTGSGSVWGSAFLSVGRRGVGNLLVVTNGGTVLSAAGVVGNYPESDRNLAVVTGPGTVWSNANGLYIGGNGHENRLTVSNGGTMVSRLGFVGLNDGSDSNVVVVTGPGSAWNNAESLRVGFLGRGNRLEVIDGGTVFGSNIVVGHESSGTNIRVVVNGGTLRATNAAGTSFLDVRRGTNVLNAGLVDVDNLVLTNQGIPLFQIYGNGGTNTIPNQQGQASPYPSTIAVAGLAGGVSRVTVTLSNLSHQFPDTVSILLRSPAGQSVMLMSGAGGFNNIANVRLVFDDNAATLIPDNSVVSGTNRPSYYPPDRVLPGVSLPYATNLSAFKGSNPNGNWSLYIYNNSFSGGSLRGWSVGIETDAPFPGSGLFELNSGTLSTRGADIDNRVPFVVGGAGGVPAMWEVLPGENDHFVTSDLIIGSLTPTSTNNLLRVSGGTLVAGLLDVRGGTNRLDSGLLEVARLVVTNSRGQVELNGGSLRTPDTTVANGRIFTVGNGASTATLQLLGGTHSFANNLVVASNASLIGNGLVDGAITVSTGGRLVPGAPIGRLDVLGTVILQGAVNLQIDKSGGVRTNDHVTASGAIFYGGTLNVVDIGTDVLAAGDRFQLFSATPLVGSFTSITLPPLAPGLTWTNRLAVDGSIEIVPLVVSQPNFSTIGVSGTSVIVSGTNGTPGADYTILTATNVTTPLSNWVSVATNQFGVGGGFAFTNAIVPGVPQRFFRIRTP